jgi:hypothetical protein
VKANQLATVLLRVLGIYCLVEAIPLIVQYIGPFFDKIISGAIFASSWLISLIGSRIIIGILLIKYAESWGEKLVSKNANEENASAITLKQAQALAFAIAGVLIFANALPQLFNSIFTLLRATASNTYLVIQPRRIDIEYAIGAIAKAIFGITLFFGAEGFANFWRSFRNFATPKPPQT